ncbi:hypothetical protein ABEB36_009693 [Hypothenemus hampei]|uniref:receptor protein serine/threonine kinase n=1 Tax=Hypothenemus hampei TaxID=57062 RepID=A0ABD1EK45_HYPHA
MFSILTVSDTEQSFEDLFEDDKAALTCFCSGTCADGEQSCQTKRGGKCFASSELVLDDDGIIRPVQLFGCLPPNEMALIQCRAKHMKRQKYISCCDRKDFCNEHMLVVAPGGGRCPDCTGNTWKIIIPIALVLGLLILVAVWYFIKIIRKNKRRNRRVCNENVDIESATNSDNIMINLSFNKKIATGQFTKIWEGEFRTDRVAIKEYNSQGKQYYLNESKIFQNSVLTHENIVYYIAAHEPDSERMLVITEYIANGSLRQFLKNNPVTPEELFDMVLGVCRGLNYLHEEILGSNMSRKPSITHNNINSSNILVNSLKLCRLCDFARATSFQSRNVSGQAVTLPSDLRYAAPEILLETTPTTVEFFTRADIYSFSIVIWEIMNRCNVTVNNQYQIPFDEELEALQLDVTRDNLLELVEERCVRPVVRNEWLKHSLLRPIVKIMLECWNGTPTARLTGLRIKKTLKRSPSDNENCIVPHV